MSLRIANTNHATSDMAIIIMLTENKYCNV